MAKATPSSGSTPPPSAKPSAKSSAKPPGRPPGRPPRGAGAVGAPGEPPPAPAPRSGLGQVTPTGIPSIAPPMPPYRRLRVFAFDPSLATRLETVGVNQATVQAPWEPKGKLQPGPCGEYVEVIDVDAPSGCFYAPVDLTDDRLLAQDGLAPADGNPQFHQQMCYAVCMRVIDAFEQALGRRVLWAERRHDEPGVKSWSDRFVRRLRIHPHALREANAFYSPAHKALLFGYFDAGAGDGLNLPGGAVFTCLSHDIVAHEVTHAILDGTHPLFLESTNPDVHAFHEAFADIIALFHHFSIPGAVRDQIARTRGDLRSENLLGELAQQFGQAIGGRGALRSAIGGPDASGVWRRAQADPALLESTFEPHARGAILLAAVFDAFLSIYERRAAGLVRLATGGTGVLPAGRMPELLVDAVAGEAAKVADQFLRICIRALDYCAPSDITFGEYLRAMITADFDMVPDDPLNYRVALVDSFRRWGIYPPEVRSLSVESLLWRGPRRPLPGLEQFSRRLAESKLDRRESKLSGAVSKQLERGLDPAYDFAPDSDRLMTFLRSQQYQLTLSRLWIPELRKQAALCAEELGLALGPNAPRTITRNQQGEPKVWVRGARAAQRRDPTGRTRLDLVVELVQTRDGYDNADDQQAADEGRAPKSARAGRSTPSKAGDGDSGGRAPFRLRGGCTLLIDLERAEVRYAIRKNILSQRRLELMRTLRTQHGLTLGEASSGDEPFAAIHRGC